MVTMVFLALALVILIGSILVYVLPDFSVDDARKNINKLVLYLFLPALNFNVVYSSSIGREFWQIPVVALFTLIVCIALGICAYAFFPSLAGKSKAALLLACAFGNVTYFGIAVLQGLFPSVANETIKVVVLFEITLTPFGLIVGAILSELYQKNKNVSLIVCVRDAFISVFKMPLLWTTFIAIVLNLMHVPVPSFILRGVSMLASTVAGLMILSLGMALKYPVLMQSFRRLHVLIPVVLIKLIISPIVMLLSVYALHMEAPYFQASVLEGAMPSQLISLVIADRFNLDTGILAVAISLDTVLAFFTLPATHHFLMMHFPL